MSRCHPFRSEKAKDLFLAHYDCRAEEWPVPSDTRMVNTAQGQTFVRVSGPADGPPLVLLHGINGNALQWTCNILSLSRLCRVYAIDVIGDYGRSVPVSPLRTSDDYLAWLDALLAALEGERQICLMGLSYGGWLAALYALHAPQRLAKVVLVAPVCTVLPLSPIWMARALTCFLPSPYFTRKFLDWMLEDLAASGPQGRRTIERQSEESYLAMRSFKPRRVVGPTVLSDDELRSIQVPTLFLVGEREKVYSARKAVERLNKVAPHIRTELIPGAGHDLTAVQAELVNAQVMKFLHQR